MPRWSSAREVAAERPDRDEQQQRQADEDVRAVQAGEAVEDRALRMVLRREAEVDVLVDLDEQERAAEQERGEDAGLEPAPVALLCACSAQCSVNEDEIRIAVLTPAISFGSSVPSAGQSAPCTTRMKK